MTTPARWPSNDRALHSSRPMLREEEEVPFVLGKVSFLVTKRSPASLELIFGIIYSIYQLRLP